MNDKTIKKIIRDSMGIEEKQLNEANIFQARKYQLPTELLSEKLKGAHQQIINQYTEDLSRISIKLDTANRDEANHNSSEFRSLKIDEVDNLNAAWLHALYFQNISDLRSIITMDSLTFMRLERDFGSFDAWQKDFIACCLSVKCGWAVCVYNSFLGAYQNVVVEQNSIGVPFSASPIIVMDCWEHAYHRDYLNDKKAYVYAMMKELQWEVIEDRVKKAEKIAKIWSQQ